MTLTFLSFNIPDSKLSVKDPNLILNLIGLIPVHEPVSYWDRSNLVLLISQYQEYQYGSQITCKGLNSVHEPVSYSRQWDRSNLVLLTLTLFLSTKIPDSRIPVWDQNHL